MLAAKLAALALIAAVVFSGCMVYADPAVAVSDSPTYGCTIVEDAYGEREVCGVYYYAVGGSVVYYDPYYHLWIGAGGYYNNGVWVRGYYPGYVVRYGGYYRAPGYYRGYHGVYRGTYGGYHGGYHGVYRGGFHGGYHR